MQCEAADATFHPLAPSTRGRSPMRVDQNPAKGACRMVVTVWSTTRRKQRDGRKRLAGGQREAVGQRRLETPAGDVVEGRLGTPAATDEEPFSDPGNFRPRRPQIPQEYALSGKWWVSRENLQHFTLLRNESSVHFLGNKAMANRRSIWLWFEVLYSNLNRNEMDVRLGTY